MSNKLHPGQVIQQRYKVLQEIGRGGYSIVYSAEDQVLGTTVALKMVMPPPAEADEICARLQREVRILRGLVHPNIIKAHDILLDGQQATMVMQYVSGMNLAERVERRGPCDPVELRTIASAAAAALECAHSAGIVHRDIKPQNILLESNGHIWLSDFGSATFTGGQSLTATGAVIGTLGFMAPEVLNRVRADLRADLYSLGVTLYFSLTGAMPGDGQAILPTPTDIGFDPRERRADCPEGLAAIIRCATRKDPADRFPTAASFLRAIQEVDAGPNALAIGVPPALQCVSCGNEGLSNLGICGKCIQASDADTSMQVYIEPVKGAAFTRRIHENLRPLLPQGVSQEVIRETLSGVRPFSRTSPALGEKICTRLRAIGVEASLRPYNGILSRFPREIIALSCVLIALTASATLLSGPSAILPSVGVLAALFYFSGAVVGRPLLDAIKQPSALPEAISKRSYEILARISQSPARKMAARIIRLAEALCGEYPGKQSEILGILSNALGAVEKIETIDSRLQLFRTAGVNSEAMNEILTLERSRDEVMHLLLRIAGSYTTLLVAKSSPTASLEVSGGLEEFESSAVLLQESYRELDGR